MGWEDLHTVEVADTEKQARIVLELQEQLNIPALIIRSAISGRRTVQWTAASVLTRPSLARCMSTRGAATAQQPVPIHLLQPLPQPPLFPQTPLP